MLDALEECSGDQKMVVIMRFIQELIDSGNSRNFRVDTGKGENNTAPCIKEVAPTIRAARWKGGEFIMKKERWDEEALENLFKQAPKVTDHRTKDEVLQRLNDEGSFNEQPPEQQKTVKKSIRWTPLIASIASLFLISRSRFAIFNE